MKTTITAKKMQIPTNFTEYTEKRIDTRLGKFFGDIFRAERSAEDKYVALDDAIDKIIRQIRKNKTKVEKKLKDTAFKEAFAYPVPDSVDYEVIKHKKFKMRPMDIDEAILQMNMLDHEFFMFTNADTGLINVVYKRADGNYAVLEPDND